MLHKSMVKDCIKRKMRGMIIGINPVVICIVLLSLFSVTCQEEDYINTHYDLNVHVKWENVPQENKNTRSFDTEQTTQVLDDFYASLGNRITFDGHSGLTPTKFCLGVKGVPIAKVDHGGMDLWHIGLDSPPEYYHIDFLQPNAAGYTIDGGNGYYSEVVLAFATVNKIYTDHTRVDTPVLFKPSIEVEIPGYTIIDFPNVYAAGFEIPEDNPIDGTVLYERKRISANTFHCTPGFLMPNYTVVDNVVTPYRPYMDIDVDSMDYEIWEGRVLPVEWFVFNDSATEMVGAFPGYPGEDLSVWLYKYADSIYYLEDTTSYSLLRYPFDGIFLDAEYYFNHNCEQVIITIGMDMDEIIEVYDNNTAADKTDDIVVLAYGWWNRFSINVSYE